MLIRADRSVLIVVDVQERLLPAMHEPDRVVGGAAILLQAARAVGVPALASEQYPKGLGPTVAALKPYLGNDAVVEKIEFSAGRNDRFRERLARTGRSQAVICGIEAHVCVLQTAFDLKAQGYDVFVVADATASRRPESRDIALARLRQEGIAAVTVEMAAFEWMGRADVPAFKDVSRLIR